MAALTCLWLWLRSLSHRPDLGLLLSVAAALPGVHGSPVAGFFGRCAGLIQPSVAIHEQLACDLGQPEVEERVDVELVPEDVPAVGLAVKAAGRNPGVEVGRVRRADLQDVGNVQADQKLNTLVPGDPDVAGGLLIDTRTTERSE